jgi:hypothetical protein
LRTARTRMMEMRTMGMTRKTKMGEWDEDERKTGTGMGMNECGMNERVRACTNEGVGTNAAGGGAPIPTAIGMFLPHILLV